MLKMSELQTISDTPKSTILYYVKEGLLPEPDKQKQNFHLYDEKCAQTIEFIKYLQLNFSCSIAQIKELFKSENFDASNPYASLFENLELVMGPAHAKIYSADELLDEFKISQKELKNYVKDGFLSPREGNFTAKEREILEILVNLNDDEKQIVQTYLKEAKKLAALEAAVAQNAVKKGAADNDARLKRLLDVLLILKPYVFNMQTLNAYKKEEK